MQNALITANVIVDYMQFPNEVCDFHVHAKQTTQERSTIKLCQKIMSTIKLHKNARNVGNRVTPTGEV